MLRIRASTRTGISRGRGQYSTGPVTGTTNQVRAAYLDYFRRNNHLILPSSSLIPKDPSLLFTTAGMVQFKDYFLNLQKPPATLIATSQKCVRAGGKHNDLENVGHTARHQTFFEMLGNFSFGEHTKKDAINVAWNFLTKELALPAERLSVSILQGDEETADIWKQSVGLPDSKIRRLGKEDNFWSMGDGEGPCGPCTEIHWDQLKDVDGERHLEIWNLVFMQYQKNADGSVLTPLPKTCVDTGMGLERITSVIQGKGSNWETDNLEFLSEKARDVISSLGLRIPTNRATEIAIRVIVDHIRATTMLIAEGLSPGAQGRAYVLRRIIRRAARYGNTLGIKGPFLHKLVRPVVDTFAAVYPELDQRVQYIESILFKEEENFFASIERAVEMLDTVFANPKLTKNKIIPGREVFKLYNSYGFPADLTEIVAKERGWTTDQVGFEDHLKTQREQSKETWKGSGDATIPTQVRTWTTPTTFVGYSQSSVDGARIVNATEPAPDGTMWLAIDPCPFYAESGGQVGDKGTLTLPIFPDHPLQVLDAVSYFKGTTSLLVKLPHQQVMAETLRIGAAVNAQVDEAHRRSVKRNHTATHLLHAALRAVLGPHVHQAGSLVEATRLRFDFSHDAPLSSDQLDRIELWVNRVIAQGSVVQTEVMKLEDAKKRNAMALFGEKYEQNENIRVVSVGSHSLELCGGTHVADSSQLMAVKILSQQSVGSGIRRIEAVSGADALEVLQDKWSVLNSLADMLRIDDSDALPSKIRALLEGQKAAEKQISQLQTQLLSGESKTAEQWEGTWNAQSVLVTSYSVNDPKVLRQSADKLRSQQPNTIHVIVSDQKIFLTCGQGNAGKLMASLFADLPGLGRGGGGANLAEGHLTVERGVGAELVALPRPSLLHFLRPPSLPWFTSPLEFHSVQVERRVDVPSNGGGESAVGRLGGEVGRVERSVTTVLEVSASKTEL